MKRLAMRLSKSLRFKIIFLIFIEVSIYGQSIPLNSSFFRDYVRRQQLLGRSDSSNSHAILPLDLQDYPELKQEFLSKRNKKNFRNTDTLHYQFYPIIFDNLWNAHHPYGDNLGSMFPVRGYQSRITAGLYIEKGNFRFQLAPEFIFAENKYFEQFAPDLHPYYWNYMFAWWNRIDLPVRFGTEHIFKVFSGQSKVSYQTKLFEYSISTENMWWGPAKRNSILLGNSAPGFPHLRLRSSRPIKSAMGSFETSLFSGLLADSEQKPPSEYFIKNIYDKLFIERNKSLRYFTGFNLVFQPKGLKGLFLGFSRTSQIYFDQINSAWHLSPFFNGSPEIGVNADLVTVQNLALTSFYFRMLLAESNAEFYGEFGKQNGFSERKILLNPFSKGPGMFTIGLSKAYKWKYNEGISVDIELSQNGLSDRELIRSKSSFYTHGVLRHGYTHRGRMLGANLGPGGNVQFGQLAWFDGIKSMGLFLERRVHNNDFYYFSYELPYPDSRGHWVDLSVGLSSNFHFKKIILSVSLVAIKSYNYQWVIFMRPGIPFSDGRDVMNYNALARVQWQPWD